MCSRGTRCHICTGCGRCFQERSDLQVITGNNLTENWQNNDLKMPENQELRKNQCINARNNKVIAVDIGTTTIAMALYDDKGFQENCFVTVNPQVKYGADVLSRIQAAEDLTAAKQMQSEVLAILECGIRRFRQRGKEETDCSYRMAAAGNTTMVYLLCGLDPAELGRAPFRASHLSLRRFSVDGVEGVIIPGISAFVGADVLAGIYACDMAERSEITLFIDLGTNGEMALGNCEGVTACATAAGPAFEGGATKGIWGADMVHLAAELRRKGILDETGLMADEYFEEGIRIGDALITQRSIRELQLAKAAIAAGIRILVKEHGLSGIDQIDRVVLAGGFGYYLQASDAACIGLLPKELAKKTVSAGNTVLAGLNRCAVSICDTTDDGFGDETVFDRLKALAGLVKVINLAQQETFSDCYLEAMDLKEC